MQLRPSHPDDAPDDRSPRLNLLLSYGGWRSSSAVDQIACVLEPLGIMSLRASSGEEAADVIRRVPIHIAVVDLSLPLHARPAAPSTSGPGGARLLQILRRLDPAPPTVIVRPPQPAARESARGLSEALREGAFAVLDRPLRMETLLEVMRRVLRRHYSDHWPDTQTGAPGSSLRTHDDRFAPGDN